MARTKTAFFTNMRESIQSGVSRKVLMAAGAFMAGFLLSKTYVFERSSPFAISFLAAVDMSFPYGFFALAGVLAGYITSGTAGIKYALAATAILALRLVLKRRGVTKENNIFIAVSCGIMLFVTGIAEASQYGFILYDMLLSLAEAIICSTIAYFFMKAQPFFLDRAARTAGLSQRELISVVITLSVFMLSLSDISLFNISAGRVLGIFTVLIASLYGGMAYGSMTGVIVGLVMSLKGGQSAYIVGDYAFGGLLSGVFSDLGRVGVSVAFVLANAVLTMYFNGSSEILINITEIVAAGVIFILLPEKQLKSCAKFIMLYEHDEKQNPEKFKTLFLTRLKSAAKSFSQLADTIKTAGALKKTDSADDISLIIGKAADTVCKRCRSCMFCWGTAYNDTMNVFNDLSSLFASKSRIDKEDIPAYFAKRCEKKDELVSELNLRFTEYWAKERQEIKTEENRVILAEQYLGVSQIMDKMAHELNSAIKFDNLTEQRTKSYLIKQGIKNPNVSCYTDADGLFNIEASAVIPVELPPVRKFTAEISQLAGCEMEIGYMNEDAGIWHTKLSEREDFCIACARASCGKDGKSVCGDTSSAFRADGGKYIMTISDGMGSGREAEKDSLLTVAFLEKLLKAGFDRESALKLVNSALILKSPDESFATVDITVINLVSGMAEFIKAGAAPTFIKRGASVYELGCSSLPAGILADAKFEKSKCRLKESDMVIMASDGVTAAGSKIITHIASSYKGDSPAELAELILSESTRITGLTDDMTVAVGLMSKKE